MNKKRQSQATPPRHTRLSKKKRKKKEQEKTIPIPSQTRLCIYIYVDIHFSMKWETDKKRTVHTIDDCTKRITGISRIGRGKKTKQDGKPTFSSKRQPCPVSSPSIQSQQFTTALMLLPQVLGYAPANLRKCATHHSAKVALLKPPC